jgi:dCTP deaminase
MDGILSGPEILKRIREGAIEVDPFVEANLNPNSLDLTLGTRLAVYDRVVDARISPPGTIPGALIRPRQGFDTFGGRPREGAYLDMAQENGVVHFDIDDRGFLLLPGIMYLAHTAERVLSKRDVPVLDGKSSVGRLGIKIHLTAGYGDVGFDGQYTLEVEVTHPVRVYAGCRFCQIRFHTVCGDLVSYQDRKSNYVGELARGPVPSRAWKMFLK